MHVHFSTILSLKIANVLYNDQCRFTDLFVAWQICDNFNFHAVLIFISGDLVVYGGGLDAYCMLGAVIDEGGLAPDRLILVVPPSSLPPAFSNDEIATTVANHLKQLAVRVVKDAELIAMEIEDEGQLSALRLRTGEGVVTLPCAALVYMTDKQVDQQLFKGTFT